VKLLLATGRGPAYGGKKHEGEGVFDRAAAATVQDPVDRRKTEVKGDPG